MATEKPTATFAALTGWIDLGTGGIQARLWCVNHPRLGREESVVTSRVVRIEYGEDGTPTEIETRNTRYVRED